MKKFIEYKKGIDNKIAAFRKDIQEKERPRSEIETFLDLAEQPHKTQHLLTFAKVKAT